MIFSFVACRRGPRRSHHHAPRSRPREEMLRRDTSRYSTVWIQADSVGLATATRTPMSYPTSKRLSGICTLPGSKAGTTENETLYLNEYNVSTADLDDALQDSAGQSSLNTGAKNLLAVICRAHRPGRRSILYPHHTILFDQEMGPTPVMNPRCTALGEGERFLEYMRFFVVCQYLSFGRLHIPKRVAGAGDEFFLGVPQQAFPDRVRLNRLRPSTADEANNTDEEEEMTDRAR